MLSISWIRVVLKRRVLRISKKVSFYAKLQYMRYVEEGDDCDNF